ncbi:MAG: hypothetical protein R3F49_12770 [Planctomycetota bacterium]
MQVQSARSVARGALASILGLSVFGGVSFAQLTVDVNTTDDTNDVAPGDGVCADSNGNCSLRAAVQEANAGGAIGTIRLQPGALYALSLVGAGEDFAGSGDLDIRTSLTIEGRGARIDGLGADRIFDVAYRNSFVLRDATLVNGAVVGESGGALRNGGAARLFGCMLEASSATGAGASGGGVINDRGYLLLADCHVSGCSADRAGGAIEASGGDTHVEGGALVDNVAGTLPGNGGALHLTGVGTVSLRSVVVRGNSAGREGGGLWNSSGGVMSVVLCDLSDNEALGTAADDGGGALFNDGGLMEVRLCELRNNSASQGSGSGGGVLNLGGDVFVSLSRLEGNSARRAGGGVEASAGLTELFATELIGNSTGAAPGNGGGLHLTGAGIVRLMQCAVRDNVASAEGGGIWNSATGVMEAAGCTFADNTASGADADQGGGGAFNDGGTMSLDQCLFRGNMADGASGSGGGVLNLGGDLTVRATRLVDNMCRRAGGGIEAREGTTTILQVAFVNNSTGPAPGNGGGLHLTGAATATVDLSVVTGNQAANEGGGLWNSTTGTLIVTTTTIQGNAAPTGADVFNDGGTFTIDGNPVP